MVLALGATLLSGTAVAEAATSGSRLSQRPLAESAGWRGYVLDSPTPTVAPARVIVQGDAAAVTDPDALMAADGRATTIRATGAGRPALVLDLGKNVGGTVEVGVTAGDGATVRLAYSEKRDYLTPTGDISAGGTLAVNDDPDGRSDTFTARGPRTFSSPGVRGAQRWVLLQLDGPGTVSIDYVRVRVGHLRPAARDYVGRFLSSDDTVNRTWWASAYTFNIASFRDAKRGGDVVVTDAGKRDRLVWLGDLVIEAEIAGAIEHQALPVLRDTLRLFGCQQYADGYLPMASDIHVTCPDGPGPPDGPPATATAGANPLVTRGRLPEYTADYAIALAEYVQATGDAALARELLPVVRRTVGYFRAHRDGTGMFRTEGGGGSMLVINWHPFDLAPGHDAHTQAVWFSALNATAELESRYGDGVAAATALRAEADRLARATIAGLWDAKVGALRLNDLDPTGNHTHDAQVEGALSGLLGDDRAARALRFVTERLQTPYGPKNGEVDADPFMSQYVSPFIGSHELLARFSRGDGAGAMDLLRRLYGYMATHDPASTMWEKLGADGQPASYAPNQLGAGLTPDSALFVGRGSTSLAHPWAGGPVPALSRYVAGLRATAPGWSRWTVAPQPVDLRWVQGQVGTPHGPLAVRWRRGADDASFRMTVVAPPGTRGRVLVPLLDADRTVYRGGRAVWRGGRAVGGSRAVREGDAIAVPARAGRVTLAWAGRER